MAKDNGRIESDPETGEVISIEGMGEVSTALGRTLEGSEEQLSFELGSQYDLKDSTLKVATIPLITVSGQFQEGDRFKVLLEVEIEHLAFPPIKDRGFRVGTERRHHAQVLSATPHDA